jgi:hypothetical protein
MVGLIVKILGFFAGLIVIALLILNITNLWNPGTLSITAPDKEPCVRYAATHHKDRTIELLVVRFVFTEQNYGWGCYFEFGDFDVETVTPMPK